MTIFWEKNAHTVNTAFALELASCQSEYTWKHQTAVGIRVCSAFRCRLRWPTVAVDTMVIHVSFGQDIGGCVTFQPFRIKPVVETVGALTTQ